MMLKLSRPYIPTQTISSIEEVLFSGNLVQGEKVKSLENQLAKYLDTKHVVVVSSGTAALHLALLSLNIGKGDEVIVPSYSFPAVANAVELTGADCCFVDITLDDYCIDTASIESKINNKTKAIMPVHEFGQTADMKGIIRLAEKYNLRIIEDAACALGAKQAGKFAGTFGDLGCFSFHPRKILTTGEGGAIATNDSVLAEKLVQLRNHGMQPSNGVIDFIMPGFNYRMTDFQAAMGLVQLPELDDTIDIHRSQASKYQSFFKNVNGVHMDTTFTDRFQTYQTYQVIFENTEIRNHIKKELFHLGIESNIGAYAIPCQSYYQNKYNLEISNYLNANKAFNNGLALPIGRHISDDNIAYISTSIIKLLDNGL